LPNLRIVEWRGHIDLDSEAERREKIKAEITPAVKKLLTEPVAKIEEVARTAWDAKKIVFKGTFEEVNEFFYKNQWRDGLPIVPPTLEKVEEFLKFTDRSPDQVLGTFPPGNRQVTVWTVAVNGVMAGCRPEYMPILIAATEAIAEPQFRLEAGGSTPGWQALVTLNGPIVRQLGFNYGQGLMYGATEPNTTIGRFMGLMWQNAAGIYVGSSNKGSIGIMFQPVLAEDEDAVAKMGWQPYSVQRGFKAGENVVTVQGVVGISAPSYSSLDNAEYILRDLANELGSRQCAWWGVADACKDLTKSRLGFYGWYAEILMSPSVAEVLAAAGYSKDDVRRYLYKNSKAPAAVLERGSWNVLVRVPPFTFCRAVEESKGEIPKEFCESQDPNRLVPIWLSPDHIGIVVAGDPGRNQNWAYLQNHGQGWPQSKRIELPKNWNTLLGSRR
jgi:hypothetical protein